MACEIWNYPVIHGNVPKGKNSLFLDGTYHYSFVAERFKIHSLWPRRSRGFKPWILKREYTKRFSVQLR